LLFSSNGLYIPRKPKIDLVCILAIYFLSEGGSVERRDFRCLFCEAVFDERKVLNLHYIDAHSPAFSAEELIMAAARRAHEVADTVGSASSADA
jgi:hypothetical protein